LKIFILSSIDIPVEQGANIEQALANLLNIWLGKAESPGGSGGETSA